jgi:hypothetical protein
MAWSSGVWLDELFGLDWSAFSLVRLTSRDVNCMHVHEYMGLLALQSTVISYLGILSCQVLLLFLVQVAGC